MDTKKHARKRTKATHQLVNKIKRSEEEREVEKGTVVHVRLDPRENRPISRIFSHRIQMAQHRLGPCRVVKITIDALPVHW